MKTPKVGSDGACRLSRGSATSFVMVALFTLSNLGACDEGFVVGDLDAAPAGDAQSTDAGADHDGGAADATSPRDSSADTMMSGEDSGIPRDPCDPPNPCADACMTPWLLAAAQDLDGAGRCGGRVFRYSLAGPEACACPSYQTGDDNYPTTASYIPGGQVLVGTVERAFTFGRSRSERYLDGRAAIASFIVEGETPGSAPVGILTAGTPGGNAAKNLLVFGADGSFDELPYEMEMSITSNTSTQNPANRRGYRSADLGRPSVNRLFWEGGVEDLMHFDSGIRGTLEAFYADGFHRTVLGVPEGVRHVANRALRLNNAPATQACAGSEYEECRYLAAAPDPTSEHHVYVACEQPIDERRASRIARLDLRDDSCVDLLGFEHWRRIRITHLSVGLEDYWAP